MIIGQEGASWLTYTIVFSIFAVTLITQSISSWRTFPFALYSICIAGGSLYALLTPAFNESNIEIAWRDQEPIINHLPVFSVLLFVGVIDWQLQYVRFITAALKNHRRWGSLHPVIITEKGDATSGPYRVIHSHCVTDISTPSLDQVYAISTSNSSSVVLRTWIFWIYIASLTLYGMIVIAFVSCKVLIDDSQLGALISAICISILTFPIVLNAMAVIYTGSKCHSKLVSRIMGQNKQDAIILCLMPVLLMIVMSSTTITAWVAYTRTDPFLKPFDDNLSLWIFVKSLTVYIPLTILLVCCMFKRKKYGQSAENMFSETTANDLPALRVRPHHFDRNHNKILFKS